MGGVFFVALLDVRLPEARRETAGEMRAVVRQARMARMKRLGAELWKEQQQCEEAGTVDDTILPGDWREALRKVQPAAYRGARQLGEFRPWMNLEGAVVGKVTNFLGHECEIAALEEEVVQPFLDALAQDISSNGTPAAVGSNRCHPLCVVIHGKQGTGKSYLSERLAAALGAQMLVLRSADVQHARLGEGPRALAAAVEAAKRAAPTLIVVEDAETLIPADVYYFIYDYRSRSRSTDNAAAARHGAEGNGRATANRPSDAEFRLSLEFFALLDDIRYSADHLDYTLYPDAAAGAAASAPAAAPVLFCLITNDLMQLDPRVWAMPTAAAAALIEEQSGPAAQPSRCEFPAITSTVVETSPLENEDDAWQIVRKACPLLTTCAACPASRALPEDRSAANLVRIGREATYAACRRRLQQEQQLNGGRVEGSNLPCWCDIILRV